MHAHASLQALPLIVNSCHPRQPEATHHAYCFLVPSSSRTLGETTNVFLLGGMGCVNSYSCMGRGARGCEKCARACGRDARGLQGHMRTRRGGSRGGGVGCPLPAPGRGVTRDVRQPHLGDHVLAVAFELLLLDYNRDLVVHGDQEGPRCEVQGTGRLSGLRIGVTPPKSPPYRQHSRSIDGLLPQPPSRRARLEAGSASS
jgi:hypothetical protein